MSAPNCVPLTHERLVCDLRESLKLALVHRNLRIVQSCLVRVSVSLCRMHQRYAGHNIAPVLDRVAEGLREALHSEDCAELGSMGSETSANNTSSGGEHVSPCRHVDSCHEQKDDEFSQTLLDDSKNFSYNPIHDLQFTPYKYSPKRVVVNTLESKTWLKLPDIMNGHIGNSFSSAFTAKSRFINATTEHVPKPICVQPNMRPTRIPSNPKHRLGIPMPAAHLMRTNTLAKDGSVFAVLDSGADAGLTSYSWMIRDRADCGMTCIGFNSHETVCDISGGAAGECSTMSGKQITIQLGYMGLMPQVNQPLISVPLMRELGYQFYLCDFPYVLTPQGHELPLYVKDNGFLCLRLSRPEPHKVNSVATQRVAKARKGLVPHRRARIGWLKKDAELWHHRLCHQDDNAISKTVQATVGMPSLDWFGRRSGNRRCVSCAIGKASLCHIGPTNFKDKEKMTVGIKEAMGSELEKNEYYQLEQLHMDCCEMDQPDFYGNKVFLIIRDRMSGFMWTYPMKTSKDVWKVFDLFMEKVVQPYFNDHPNTDGSVNRCKTLRTDFGSEFRNKDMERVLTKYGGISLNSAPSPDKDGTAERAIRFVTSLTRTCLIEAGLRKPFWSLILETVVHVANRTYNITKGHVPYTALLKTKPSVKYFRQPGCFAAVFIQDKKRKKMDPKAKLCIFVGYDIQCKTWVFVDPKNGTKIRTNHCQFFERKRDPHEHIDLADMILTAPQLHFNSDTLNWVNDDGCWKCTLWPMHRWPNRSSHEVTKYTLDASLWDPDVLNWDNAPLEFQNPGVDLILDETMSPEEAEKLKKNYQDHEDKWKHDSSSTQPLFPGNILRFTKAKRTGLNQYRRTRLSQMEGLRVREALNGMRFQDAKGKWHVYKPADLRYDLGLHGGIAYLESVPAPSQEETDDGEVSEAEEKEEDGEVSEVEEEKEESNELEPQKAPNRRRRTKRVTFSNLNMMRVKPHVASCTDPTHTNCHVSTWSEIHHTQAFFPQDYSEEDLLDSEGRSLNASGGEEVYCEFGGLDDFDHTDGLGMRNLRDESAMLDEFPEEIRLQDGTSVNRTNADLNESHLEEVDDGGYLNVTSIHHQVGQILPTDDEIYSYRGDGTYVARDGVIHRSHHVQQINADQNQAEYDALLCAQPPGM